MEKSRGLGPGGPGVDLGSVSLDKPPASSVPQFSESTVKGGTAYKSLTKPPSSRILQ